MALPGLPIWHFLRNGYQVVAYDYNISIATESSQLTVAVIESIISDAEARINDFKPAVSIFCYGTSMGTVMAANVAARNHRVKKIVLNMSYADIATHIYHLPFMVSIPPRLLKRYIDASGGEAGLHQFFDDYSPLLLAHHFKGKEVMLYLARNDRIHQPEHTRHLSSALRDAGAHITYHNNPILGHYFGCLYNHLRAQRYLDFFDKS